MKWKLNEKQKQFIESPAKYVAYIGGRGCGKSLALILKLIQLMLEYPGNYGLVGRYNYSDLKDSTMKDFFDICPPDYIRSYNKQEKQVIFYNNSALIFRGLKEVKKTEVRSLNLGFFALEQAEEMDEEIVKELRACLRKKIYDHDGKIGKQQGFFTANPSLNWLFEKFVENPNPEYELVRGSMLDNAQNLGDSFLKDMLSQPESWQRVFVYGQFDRNIADNPVFSIEYIKEQEKYERNPIGLLDDMDIFSQPIAGHQYQMGIDPSEGADDFSVIKVMDLNNGEEVAQFVLRIQPDLLAFKVDKIGRHFNNAKAVLEINGIGLATLTKLKELNYENLFIREEYDKHAKVMTKKLGWRTTHASKPLLVGHFQELLNKKVIKIRDKRTINEMLTFVYSPDAYKRGMGAQKGFHDDRVMAMMLACWEIPAEKREGSDQIVIRPQETRRDAEEILTIEQAFSNNQSKKWLEH